MGISPQTEAVQRVIQLSCLTSNVTIEIAQVISYEMSSFSQVKNSVRTSEGWKLVSGNIFTIVSNRKASSSKDESIKVAPLTSSIPKF